MNSVPRMKLSHPARIVTRILILFLMALICGPSLYHASLNERLIQAAIAGDNPHIRRLIHQGADVNAKDTYGDTPLMYAARHGHSRSAALLIASGADVNARDAYGVTAATWADNLKYEYEILSWERGGKVHKSARREYLETLALLKTSGARL